MIRKVALALVCSFFAFRASAITYLNAASTAASPNGAGWATAYKTIAEAVAASTNGDGVVYAAQGVYPLTTSLTLAADLKLYGGFPGLSDAETLADRDADIHQTIFVGAANASDVWTHVEPSTTPCGEPTVTVTAIPVISDGRITLPTAFTGTYDGFINQIPTSRSAANTPFASNGHAFVFDGIWFTGFRCQSGRNVIRMSGTYSGTSVCRVDNCRFVGNVVQDGCVGGTYAKEVAKVISGCLFFGNSPYSATGNGIGFNVSTATETITNCVFMSCMAPSVTTGGAVVHNGTGDSTNMKIFDCVFTRNYMRSTGDYDISNVSDPGHVIRQSAAHAMLPVSGCAIINNLTVSANTAAFSTISTSQGIQLLRCRLEGNRVETKAKAGDACAVVATKRRMTGNYPSLLTDGTVFVSNTLVAVLADDPGEGTYYASLIGNGGAGYAFFCLLDSVFDGNKIVAETSSTVTALRSRGLGLVSDSSSYQVQAGIANCTFLGPSEAGLYDVFQVGGSQKMLSVVNSIFSTDGYVAAPFHFPDISKLSLRCCTVKNWTPPEGLTHSGTTFDDIPVDRETYVPLARLEGIRETCDAARFTGPYNQYGQYRLPGSSSWSGMIDYYGTKSSGLTDVTDPYGASRPNGSFTRGAVQAMVAAAEDPTSHLLLVRCSPVTGGKTEPASQMVADGGSSTSLTAVPADGCGFRGWFLDGSETPLSTEATLQPFQIAADATLVAAFATASRTIEFDLGAAGTFVANGATNLVLSLGEGDSLDIPEYLENDLFRIHSWSPEVPPLVPAGDVVYRAQYVTKDVRTRTVAPGDDIQAAIDDMGIWRGEVHFTPGLYAISSALRPLPNVKLVADGAGVVLTGDTGGDDYWLPQGRDPGAGNRTAIWSAGVFAEPNSTGTDYYWKPKFAGANCPYAISQANGTTVTNFVAEGLVFTCFSDVAVNLLANSQATFRDCAFLANYSALVSTGQVSVDGGRFTGNAHATKTYPDSAALAATTNLFSGVTYSDNYSNEGSWYAIASQGKSIFTNCVFRRNCCGGIGTKAVFNIYDNGGLWRASDCLFEENVAISNSFGIIYPSGSPQFVRCRFAGNRNKDITAAGLHSAVFLMRSSDSVLVRDSLFTGNAVEGAIAASTTTSAVASVVGLFDGEARNSTSITIVNTTFHGNMVSVADASGHAVAGTFATRLASARLALVHCSVSGSEIACEGGDATGDLASPTGLAWAPRIANTVVWSEGCPGVGGGAAPVIAGGAVKGFAGSDPMLSAPLREGGGLSVPQIPVGAASDYTRNGHPVYGATAFYLHAPSVNPGSPWWNIINNDWYTEARARSSLGLDRLPRLPDAWGRERADGKIACGPLNVKTGMWLMVR